MKILWLNAGLLLPLDKGGKLLVGFEPAAYTKAFAKR